MVGKTVRVLRGENKRPQVALRRALGRLPEDPASRAAHMVVAPVLPERPDPSTERAFYAVAAMIAAQPRDARDETTGRLDPGEIDDDPDPETVVPETKRESLGAALGRAVGNGTLSESTTEARLHLLCRQDIAGVHRHLPRIITRLRADLVPVDWVRLTIDLARWDVRRNEISKRWLQDYYRTSYAIKAMQAKSANNGSEAP
nr:type I-E CRISPR-associated protein Cse2/CasB [Planomonospora venezuelensis]